MVACHVSDPKQEVAASHLSKLPGQEGCTPSEPSPSTGTEMFQWLTEDMKFEPDLANLCISNGMADLLLYWRQNL